MSVVDRWLDDWKVFKEFTRREEARFYAPTAERRTDIRSLVPSWAAADLLKVSRGTEVGAGYHDLAGRQHITSSPIHLAADLYRAGMTLYLRNVTFFDALIDDLASALRAPPSSVTCALFCNRSKASLRMHFDQINVLSVQIVGKKRWRVAPNQHAPNPLFRWGKGDEVYSDLQTYAHDLFPTEMPDTAQAFDMEPGSMLYVPAGYWHETEANEECVTLNIHFLPWSWVDAVTSTQHMRLRRNLALRKEAHGIHDPTDDDIQAAMQALAAIRKATAELTIDDLIPGLARKRAGEIGADSGVVASARGSIGIISQSADTDTSVLKLGVDEHGVEHETTVEMSRPKAMATLVIAKSTTPLSPLDLTRRVPGLGVDEAVALVRLLVEAGVARHATDRAGAQ